MTNRGLVSISGSTLGRGGRRPQAADPLGSNDIANRRYIDRQTNAAPTYGMPLDGTALLNRYDKIRGAYNFKSSNTRISDQGLARAQAGGISEQLWIGDSIMAGCVSSLTTNLFDRLNAVPMAYRNALANAGIPANGTGLVRCVDSTSFADSRWVYTGTWSNQGGYGFSTVAASTAVFSPDKSGTILDVLYYDYASSTGQFTVKVDGTTVSTVNVLGTNPVTGTGWKLIRIPNLNVVGSFSTVTITVVAPGTAGVFLAGADVWTPGAGLRVHNLSQSGSTIMGTGLTAWSDATPSTGLYSIYQPSTGLGGGPSRTVTDGASTAASNVLTSATGAFTTADLYKQVYIPAQSGGPMFPANAYITAVTGTTATLSYMVNGVQTPANAYTTQTAQKIVIGRDPDGVHVDLGSNDLQALAANPAAITNALSVFRARYPNSDFFLHLPVEFNPSYVSSMNEQAFQRAVFVLADTLDVPVFDWKDQVGSYAQGTASGWYGDFNAHQQASTYMMLGASLSALSGPGAGRNQSQVAPISDNDNLPKWYLDQRRTTTATAAALTTVETVILQLKVPANTLKVGSTIRYSGMLVPAATTITTTRVRIGTAGTTADAALNVMSATATTSSATRYVEGTASVQVVGASGTFLGIGTETVGAVTASGTQIATSGTFDTTKNLYITLTVANGTTTTTTMKSGFLELIP